MKFTVRLSTENSLTLTSDASSYNQLVEEIKSISTFPLPQSFKLIYNGEKLNDAKLEMLPDQVNEQQVVVILMEEVKLKKKKKCSFKNCSSAPLRMVGDCHHCNGKFCAKHRLLEDHMCSGLQYCKEVAHEQNALKLESERTVISKV